MSALQCILVLDFGSQYTQLITRRLREHGVFAVVRPCTAPMDLPEHCVGVVLSGGPASVQGPDAPAFDARWWDVPVPILGICYGMQLMTHHFGGELGTSARREYGRATFEAMKDTTLFTKGLRTVWMSHGDHVESVPPGFSVLGRSKAGVIAAMGSASGDRFGLQFHPEVTHSEGGSELIRAFALDVCGARGDWSSEAFIDRALVSIRDTVEDDQVILGLSGGCLLYTSDAADE